MAVLLGSCRGGGLPPQAEKTDSEADSALAHAVHDQFAVSEVILTRTSKVIGVSLVDTALFLLPDSLRRPRSTDVARWTWHRLQHPAGIVRMWVWASPPGSEISPPAGVLYSYWTKNLELTPTASQPH